MNVLLKWKTGEIALHDIDEVVLSEQSPLFPNIQRQSLIERVNQILDQYEPQDARPI